MIKMIEKKQIKDEDSRKNDESSMQDSEQPQKEIVVILNGKIIPVSQVMDTIKEIRKKHQEDVKQVMNEQGLTKEKAEAIVQMREEKESEERMKCLLEVLEKSELYKKGEEVIENDRRKRKTIRQNL